MQNTKSWNGTTHFFVLKHSVDQASTKERWKHYLVKWRDPLFLEQSVHFAKSREVKWKIPFFGVQTPRGQSQRKEGCKTPQGKVDRESNFQCTRHIFASIATTLVQKYRRIHFRKRSMAAKQALRWQILAPSGTSGTSLMGAPKHRRSTIDLKGGIPGIEAGTFWWVGM